LLQEGTEKPVRGKEFPIRLCLLWKIEEKRKEEGYLGPACHNRPSMVFIIPAASPDSTWRRVKLIARCDGGNLCI